MKGLLRASRLIVFEYERCLRALFSILLRRRYRSKDRRFFTGGNSWTMFQCRSQLDANCEAIGVICRSETDEFFTRFEKEGKKSGLFEILMEEIIIFP